MADRYTYLSYIGITFIAAVLINKLLFFNKYLISIAIVCYVILLIFLTRQQVKIWENSESLWTRVIELYPHLERPWRGRGKYYAKQSARTKNTLVKKQYEEKALLDFREAIKLGTKQADVFEGAGCIYGSNGDHNNALGYFNKAIELKPDKGSVYFNRGLTLSMLNKNQEAIKDYNLALIYAPQKAVEIITNRSNLFLITGRYKEAIADFDYLISVDSKNFLFYYNRAFAKQQTNDVPGAVIDYLKALQLQPDDQMSKLQLQKLLLVKK
jgi:tetratricopeptide (TPR) repeat protein